jgi:hypothetical protein
MKGLVFALFACACRGTPQPDVVVTQVQIPMRDGVKLAAQIFAPRGDAPHGIVLDRSPYKPWDPKFITRLNDRIIVNESLRGRFKSGGTFVMIRPPADGANAVDETTDAEDTIAWLVANVPHNNGHVVAFGQSYDGWTAMMASRVKHPALTCVVEMAAVGDMWLGDDFHHHGAFRLSYGFEYATMEETDKDKDTNFAFDLGDTYDWYLRLGALSHADERYLHGKLPTWESFIAHPDRDAFWQRQAVTSFVHEARVPTLHVAGWWDQEDPYGPIAIYRELAAHDPRGLNHLVVGPWNHGGWWDNDPFGPFTFPGASFAMFRAAFLEPFETRCLDGAPVDMPAVSAYETGTNRWRTYDRWPPDVPERRLYLRANRTLSFEPPTTDEPADTYVSDPANPVPYRHRPISPTYPDAGWANWLVEDQRFVDHRPDVLTFETAPLDRAVAISGEVGVELWAATTGTDSDWIVKLIDVLPEGAAPDPDAGVPDQRGYELMISEDILRGRYRDDWEHASAIPANQPVRYHIDLHTRAHAFLPGHRIMVQIQSTWFPLYDRNPQQFVPSIYTAKDSDYVAATQSILHTAAMPSAIVIHLAH